MDIDPYNGARATVVTARLHCRFGNMAAAYRLAGSGLNQMQQLGSEFGAAEAHEILAEAVLNAGDVVTARRHFDNALATYAALNSPRERLLRARLGDAIYPTT